jgi:hypothetical protein
MINCVRTAGWKGLNKLMLLKWEFMNSIRESFEMFFFWANFFFLLNATESLQHEHTREPLVFLVDNEIWDVFFSSKFTLPYTAPTLLHISHWTIRPPGSKNIRFHLSLSYIVDLSHQQILLSTH